MAVFALTQLAQRMLEANWVLYTAYRFAWGPEPDRLATGRWTVAATGAPVLEDALAWLDCRVHSRHEAGTHSLWIGEVVASAVPRPDERPLVYWNRGYRSVTDA